MAHDHKDVETNRIEALGDGIFAIAMTLLVLELKLPSGPLAQGLIQSWPSLLSFFISFIVLGIYWIGHRLMFHFFIATNRTFLWINIVFFMSICLVPFSASLLGQHPSDQLAITIYGANLIFCSVAVFWIWTYATKHRQLTEAAIPAKMQCDVRRHLLIAPALYLLAIVLAFWWPIASIAIYIVVPIFYIVPNRIDMHLPHHKE